jgi:uncharacterized RDD family membrane protein YckC
MPDDDQRSSLGRWARYPARAAARASRGPLEAAADELAPEISKIADRMLAGELPEHVARAMAEHHVIERVVEELAATGALDDAVGKALASPRTTELVERIVASEAMQRAIRDAASSPEVRAAMREQSIGMWEELAGDLHERGVEVDGRIEHAVRRRPVDSSTFAGLATRAAGFALDIVLVSVLLGIASALVALVRYVFDLHPGWVAETILGGGAVLIALVYFVFFWSGAGRTPGMHVLGIRVRDPAGKPPSVRRAAVRALVMAFSIAILFLGYLPVLFDRRRRALPDLLAGTEVVYTASYRAATASQLTTSHQAAR